MEQRRDARRNRERIVAAAREVFLERGAAATLEQIATRAGVGIGTLYRHFPTREALVEVVYQEHIDEVLAAAEQAADADDPWDGLVGLLERTLELQARNLPLVEVFLSQTLDEERAAARRKQIRPQVRRLVQRARKQGRLRQDFTAADLVAMIWSFEPIFVATAGTAPDAWRRHLQILLDGMRAEGATPQRARPLTTSELEAAIVALRRSRSGRRRTTS
jgi:AcrR family transcriptional regulator